MADEIVIYDINIPIAVGKNEDIEAFVKKILPENLWEAATLTRRTGWEISPS